ncbi:MAG TPA: OmpH family outer membrane protein [Saprospiraceae bacterium]|nr:OmpH family outer membrane protein [Saprospiraceae bacterium]
MKTVFQIFMATLMIMMGSTQVDAQKFGYINSQEIIGSMPEVKEANADIETLKQQLQKKGQEMITAFQTKYRTLEDKQAKGEISPKQLEAEAAKLKDEEQKIMEYEETSQQRIMQKGETLFKPIQDKVNQAIKDVAAENGYTYIFDASLGIILYADESTDITRLVKTKLGIR